MTAFLLVLAICSPDLRHCITCRGEQIYIEETLCRMDAPAVAAMCRMGVPADGPVFGWRLPVSADQPPKKPL
jgi:hypothetical protein